MYLRHSVRRKNGRSHTYWRLVRSVRRGGKVVQETVAQFGELDAEGRANTRLLAQQITGANQQRELFEAAASAEQRIAVPLDRVCIERTRWFGGVWLGWKLWRALKLGRAVRRADATWAGSDPITDWDAEQWWRTCIQLSDAEAAFRIHKSELAIRSIWHQREDRVQAHILVCFLAYVLWKTLEQWQSLAELGNSPRTILEQRDTFRPAA